MKILELLNFGSKLLKNNNILTHKIDSEILLSKVLGRSREKILINLDKNINDKNISEFSKLLKRRRLKEPVAYILEEKEFWSKKFKVNQNTLIPRPETELLVEELVKIYKDKSISVLDVGTGSGCILISLLSEIKQSSGIGIDISSKALTIARDNLKIHKIDKSIKLLNKSFNDINYCKFDLIVSNPPYIETRSVQSLDDDINL